MAVPWHFQDCTCKHYVQASLCAGETDPGYGVYVHEDDLPESGTGFFKYGGVCWYVSASGTRVCWPKSGQRAYPVYPFDDCDDCTSDTGGDTAGGSGGSDDGPFDGGGMGGWWGPWEWPEPTEPTTAQTKYRQLVPCTTGDNSIYIKVAVKDSTEYGPDVGSVTRLSGNRCYYVGSTLYSDLPGGGKVLYPSFPYDSCAECTNGLQAHLCPDYESYAAEAPDVWIAHEGVPTSVKYFRYAGYCYYVDPADAEATIPSDAILLSEAPDEYESCVACGPGRQATLCPNQTAPEYDVWVLEDDLPESGSIVWKHSDGLCYSIDAGTSMTPPNAHIAVPGTPYASCAACLCGMPIEGVPAAKVELCGGQDASIVAKARDWWIKQADLPAVAVVWAIDGVCVRAWPGMTVRNAPADAEFVKPIAMYDSCFQCSFYNAGDGGGGSVPLPPPYNSPPNNGPVDPIPRTAVTRQWMKCSDDSPTGVYCDTVELASTAMKPLEPVAGLSMDECYYPSQIGGDTGHDNGLYFKHNLPAGSIPRFAKRRYVGCEACQASFNTCYACGDCCFSDRSTVSFTGMPLPTAGGDYYGGVAAALSSLSSSHLAFDGTWGSDGYLWVSDYSAEFIAAGDTYRVCYWAGYQCSTDRWYVGYDVEISNAGSWEWWGGENLNYVSGVMNCCGAAGTAHYYNFDGGGPPAQDVSWTVTLENNSCCKDGDGDCQRGTPDPDCDASGATGPCEEEPI